MLVYPPTRDGRLPAASAVLDLADSAAARAPPAAPIGLTKVGRADVSRGGLVWREEGRDLPLTHDLDVL